MKTNKYIILMMLSVCLPFFAQATPTCVGGQMITSNKPGIDANGNNLDRGGYCKPDGSDCTGETFCISDGGMTWWTIFLWCESNGRRVANWEEICPGIPPSRDGHSGACPNFTRVPGISNGIYSPLLSRDKRPFSVYPDGRIHDINKTSLWQAVCK